MTHRRMQMNTAARIIAATLSLAAVIWTVTFFAVKAQSEKYEEWGEHIEDRIDLIEAKVFPDKPEKKKSKED